ncbi:MAG: hypothetical protein R2909_13470 [Gemmatimonadales bacterium]
MQSVTKNERGIALILALLITLAVAAMAMGGVMIASSGNLTARFAAKEAALHSLADGGIEIARDSINRVYTILPDTGYISMAPVSTILDAQGGAIPGYTRTVYAGRTGGRTGGPATSGQYGSNFMSVVSVIHDVRGAVAARRGLFSQESWSRFAVAIDNWSGGAVYGCAESISGPFHSNSGLKLQSGCSNPKVGFAGAVTVVGSITNPGSGNFSKGYTTGASALAWPTPAQLGLMQQYARDADVPGGDYDIAGGNTGTNRPCTRLDFAVLDSNNDGVIQWDEGYVRVFRCIAVNERSLAFVNGRRFDSMPAGVGTTATITDDPNLISPNCGNYLGGTFTTAMARYDGWVGTVAAKRDSSRSMLIAAGHRCFLGGDPRLNRALSGDSLLLDSLAVNAGFPTVNQLGGKWIRRRLGAHSSVTTVRNTIAAGGDAEFWIPLGKNPNFKGVIYVTGDVALSGRLRGRVSVVATGNILLQDDFRYWTTPGTDCSETGDIFGALAVGNVIIQDNNLQTPFRSRNVGATTGTGTYRGLWDDTPADENYDMFLLTLNNWAGDITGMPWYNLGPSSPGIPNIAGEQCGGAASGCIRITGGMSMGRVDYWTYYGLSSGNSSGWAEAHSYDVCGASNPPPYFPTTGRYIKSRYYELDPVWLNQTGIDNYFRELQSRWSRQPTSMI